MKQISIIGLGVIGGSLGKAIKAKQPQLKVVGVDMSMEIVTEAHKRGIIDYGTDQASSGVENADLVFLAVPLAAIPDTCRKIAPFLKDGAIVTDVGSTKENMVKLMEELLPRSVSFIGGHPMAGSEKWGLHGVNELLFENAIYILTPTNKTNLEAIDTVKSIIESLGAKIILLSPTEHDRKVAAVSHLPHLAASALVNTIGALEEKEQGYFTLAAGGFRDTTRIAAGNSEMWSDILQQNEKSLLPLITEFIESLQEFEQALRGKDSARLLQLLARARHWRENVPTGLKGMLSQLFELTVTVPDRPGVIAELSNLLGNNQINIIDIEIQRVREQDEGTIRLGFSEEQARDQALMLLYNNGFYAQKSGL